MLLARQWYQRTQGATPLRPAIPELEIKSLTSLHSVHNSAELNETSVRDCILRYLLAYIQQNVKDRVTLYEQTPGKQYVFVCASDSIVYSKDQVYSVMLPVHFANNGTVDLVPFDKQFGAGAARTALQTLLQNEDNQLTDRQCRCLMFLCDLAAVVTIGDPITENMRAREAAINVSQYKVLLRDWTIWIFLSYDISPVKFSILDTACANGFYIQLKNVNCGNSFLYLSNKVLSNNDHDKIQKMIHDWVTSLVEQGHLKSAQQVAVTTPTPLLLGPGSTPTSPSV